jgi:hypothetical protein
MQFGMVAPPFSSTLSISQVQTNPVLQYQLGKNVFPLLSLPPLSSSFAASLPNSTNAFLVDPNGKTPYISQWNLSIQHSFTNNDIVAHRHLAGLWNFQAHFGDYGTGSDVKPLPAR